MKHPVTCPPLTNVMTATLQIHGFRLILVTARQVTIQEIIDETRVVPVAMALSPMLTGVGRNTLRIVLPAMQVISTGKETT